MKNKAIFILSLVFASCNIQQLDITTNDEDNGDVVTASVNVRPFVIMPETKTCLEDVVAFSFSEGDKIGIVPYDLSGDGTAHTAQMSLALSGADENNTARFSSGLGWALRTNGQYSYISYYPYTANYQSAGIPMDFSNQVQTGNNSYAHVADYDFLYSDPVVPVSGSSASFVMNHLCALAKFVLTVPAEFGSASFKRLSIQAEDNVFVRSGSCNVGATVSSGSPSFDPSEYSNLMGISLSGVSPAANTVTSYVMMYPAELEGQTLTIRLWTALTNKCLTGTIECDADQENGHAYTYNVTLEASDSPAYLPDRPAPGDKLNILLISHSFGVDATEYLPALMVAAGIDNVNFGRFYYPNCSLERHWDYYENETAYSYYYCAGGSTTYGASSKTLKYVLQQKPWDIVVFQQSIAADAGDYGTYQPYLDNLITAVNEECISAHDKLPYIGWHMFWGYGGTYATMFGNIKTATQTMMADTGIQLIIPSGTAVDIARGETYTEDETTYGFIDEIYGDGFHCSRGVGRYLGSCTWFESVIKPIYGVSVVGNTYRQLEKMTGESDAPAGRKFFPVDDIKAPILQAIAATASANPFQE